ncbi:MAG: ECF-type riboflavin transporter substrate-binding protein [Erysipelotrichaceae bacterium]|nr:ECF-type riboflavin transporter substrate-binding protein [Erysipelotrichaceae bacterium]
MNKNAFSTRTLVATALGAALFFVLFKFVSIPSPVPNTNFCVAYGISTFFSVVFGPLCGGLVAFIGHALTDAVGGYGVWWSWVIGSGVCGALCGLSKINPEKGSITTGEWINFVLVTLVANAIAWPLVSAAGDVLIYGEVFSTVLPQLALAFVTDSIVCIVVGGILIAAYAKTRVGSDTLE